MTTRKLYESLGENFDAVAARFGSTDMVGRFAMKFAGDPSFDTLKLGLENRDGQQAFRAAHTLKGVAATLGFTRLAGVASELTESLRGGGITDEAQPLYEKVEAEYERVIAALKSFGRDNGKE